MQLKKTLKTTQGLNPGQLGHQAAALLPEPPGRCRQGQIDLVGIITLHL